MKHFEHSQSQNVIKNVTINKTLTNIRISLELLCNRAIQKVVKSLSLSHCLFEISKNKERKLASTILSRERASL